jgi:hypothetical protein
MNNLRFSCSSATTVVTVNGWHVLEHVPNDVAVWTAEEADQ